MHSEQNSPIKLGLIVSTSVSSLSVSVRGIVFANSGLVKISGGYAKPFPIWTSVSELLVTSDSTSLDLLLVWIFDCLFTLSHEWYLFVLVLVSLWRVYFPLLVLIFSSISTMSAGIWHTR